MGEPEPDDLEYGAFVAAGDQTRSQAMDVLRTAPAFWVASKRQIGVDGINHAALIPEEAEPQAFLCSVALIALHDIATTFYDGDMEHALALIVDLAENVDFDTKDHE